MSQPGHFLEIFNLLINESQYWKGYTYTYFPLWKTVGMESLNNGTIFQITVIFKLRD